MQLISEGDKIRKCVLTLSAFQTLTVLSADEVANRGILALKRASVIDWECSSSFDFNLSDLVHQNVACRIQHVTHSLFGQQKGKFQLKDPLINKQLDFDSAIQ